MKLAQYQWIELKEDDQWQQWQNESQYDELTTRLLYQRNITTNEEAECFFQPSLDQLHDPFLMYDMQRAVDRILRAIERNERILIYGDYDCDGITSTTVLKEALEMIGAEVEFYLPNRFTDGYGPNKDIYQYFINDGVNLIITVDNGIAGFEALSFAKESGVDVIVTDHHQIQDTLPEAYAIIHPCHPKGQYPFPYLAGVGVAFKLATALLGYIPTELLDVTAIGTIADVVSLTDENRILVYYGLKALQETPRQGLHYLAQQQQFSLDTIDEEGVSFNIAPCLNALGRMDDANVGVHLLTTFDDIEAEECAQVVSIKNKERKTLVQEMITEARELIHDDHQIQVIAKEGWHEGVLGIIASRLVDELKQPCIVLTIDPETRIAKGSGRSIGNINLLDIVLQEKDHLLSVGGHAAALGLSLKEEDIASFITSINHRSLSTEKDSLIVDAPLMIKDIDEHLFKTIAAFAPFGQDNPKPLFSLKPDKIKDIRKLGANQTTLRATACQNNDTLSLIHFNYYGYEREWLSSKNCSFVGHLAINQWNNQISYQLQVKDFQIDGIQLFDGRMQRILDEDFMQEDSCFIYFNTYHQARLNKLLPNITLNNARDVKNETRQIVLCDIPTSLDDLRQLILDNDTTRYVIMCRSFEEAYLEGMPSHEDFVKLFNFIKHNPQANVVKDLKAIADFVKIPMQNLIFMIHLFKDLGFVTINHGIMEPVTVKEKKALTSSPLYKEREQLIINEEFLLYSDLGQLIDWFQKQGEEK